MPAVKHLAVCVRARLTCRYFISGRPLGTRVRRLLSRCSSLSLGRKDRLPFSMLRMWLYPRPNLKKVRQGEGGCENKKATARNIELNCFTDLIWSTYKFPDWFCLCYKTGGQPCRDEHRRFHPVTFYCHLNVVHVITPEGHC